MLRELEGRSYKDIGERMGMSRPAVESTLFRARKRLAEEYDELASGARCVRIQGIIADGGARLGLRDQRRLARHISHCQPCRRLAAGAGLDVPVPVRRRVAEKLAGLLPLPAFPRLRRGGDDPTAGLGGGGGTWMMHVPGVTESMSSGWSKGAAGLAALALAGAGVGVTGLADSGKRDERGTGYRATAAPTAADGATAKAPRRSTVTAGRRSANAEPGSARRGGGSDRGGRATRSGAGGGGADTGSGPAKAGSGTPGGSAPVGARAPSVSTPGVPGTDDAPAVDGPAADVPNLTETVETVTDPLPDVDETITTIAPELPVDVPDPVDVVTDATEPVTDAVDDVTSGLPGP